MTNRPAVARPRAERGPLWDWAPREGRRPFVCPQGLPGPQSANGLEGAGIDPAPDEARRWVRRKRTFYTVLIVYSALVVLWFLIDVLTGTDDWWFYWPTLGAGVIVAIIGISMFGVSGLFGEDWERRQLERYMDRHRGPDDGTSGT